jgi:hypothetical protein
MKTIEKFKKMFDANPSGFWVSIETNNPLRISHWGCDCYSTSFYEDDKYLMLIQAGVSSKKNLTILKNSILKNEVIPANIEGSFFIIEKQTGHILFGRDRTQIYKLYLSANTTHVFISTSLYPHLGSTIKSLSNEGVYYYLNSIITAPVLPLYDGLRNLLSGEIFKVSHSEDLRKIINWDFQPISRRNFYKTDVPSDYNNAISTYESLLTSKITESIDSSTPVLFLSGGSDSAVVLGILKKLGRSDSRIIHFKHPHHKDADHDLVDFLGKSTGFKIDYFKRELSLDEIDQAIIANPSGSYVTMPLYYWSLHDICSDLSNASVMNGEICLLDIGFTESSDITRSLRRFLYLNSILRPEKMLKIIPASIYHLANSLTNNGKLSKALQILISILYSFGRPEYFWAGPKFGFRGLPGIIQAKNVAGKKAQQFLIERFFSNYINSINHDTPAFPEMLTQWYSEASNFTMPVDAALSKMFNPIFPFSSPETTNFFVSLPTSWQKDKKIQKDMSYKNLCLPYDVAYHLKNHTVTETPIEQLLYSRHHSKIRDRILDTLSESLSDEEKIQINDRLKNNTFTMMDFNYYCISLYKSCLQID